MVERARWLVMLPRTSLGGHRGLGAKRRDEGAVDVLLGDGRGCVPGRGRSGRSPADRAERRALRLPAYRRGVRGKRGRAVRGQAGIVNSPAGALTTKLTGNRAQRVTCRLDRES